MSLFGRSRVRDRILVEFFAKRGTDAHGREIARRVGASPATVSTELASLRQLGVLQTRTVGRSIVYSVNERSPFIAELRGLVLKTIGVEGLIRKSLERLPGVDAAYIFGSYASGTDTAQSDVDLLVIGRPDRVVLSEQLARVERAIGRDVNVVIRSEAQLRVSRRHGEVFWQQVAAKPMIHVAGREISITTGFY